MKSRFNSRLSVMTSIILAMLIISIDTTIMNTTMPVVAGELGDMNLYAWIFAGYMISSTVLSPISGRLSDLFGRKRVFAAGIVMFLFGSMLCGMSQTMLQLVLFRFAQGIGAGFMMPFPAIIAGDLFPVEKRGKIQALFTAMWGLAAVIAPLLGAFFVEYATWRWIFYINIPVSVAAFLLLMPYKEEYEPRRSPVDYGGAALFAGAVTLLLMLTVVSSGHVWYALGGLLLLVLFVLYERRQPSPLVPLPMVRKPEIAWMTVTGFLSCAALFGSSSYIPMYLQEQGPSVFMSGVALLGTAAGWMAMSVPAGKWILRFGYRPLFIIGNGLLVCTGLLLLPLNASTAFLYVAAVTVVLGAAYGLITTVTIIGAQQLVSPHEKGISTSIQLLSRNIGTAVGVTVMGAILLAASDFFDGVRNLFLYGTAVSVLALGSSFMIRERKPAVQPARADG